MFGRSRSSRRRAKQAINQGSSQNLTQSEGPAKVLSAIHKLINEYENTRHSILNTINRFIPVSGGIVFGRHI